MSINLHKQSSWLRLLLIIMAWPCVGCHANCLQEVKDTVAVDTLPVDTMTETFDGYMLSEVVVRPKFMVSPELKMQMNSIDLQLQQSQPQGFNPLGLIAWGISKLIGPRHKMTREEKFKKVIENY